MKSTKPDCSWGVLTKIRLLPGLDFMEWKVDAKWKNKRGRVNTGDNVQKNFLTDHLVLKKLRRQ
jgi:hypothetical protein